VRPVFGDAVAFLRDVQSAAVDVHRHEHSSLSRVQHLAGLPRGEPLFDTTVAVQTFPHFGGGRYAGDDALTVRRVADTGRTNYAVALEVLPEERLTLRFRFDRARIEASTVRRVADEACAAVAHLAGGVRRT
jgi:hypothetical protein